MPSKGLGRARHRVRIDERQNVSISEAKMNIERTGHVNSNVEETTLSRVMLSRSRRDVMLVYKTRRTRPCMHTDV